MNNIGRCHRECEHSQGVRRGRPRKDPEIVKREREQYRQDQEKKIQELLEEAVTIFAVPFDDRDERPMDAPTISSVAKAMNTSRMRVRKLLITANYYSSNISRRIAELQKAGYSIEEICREMKMGRAAVHSYLPYQKVIYKRALTGKGSKLIADELNNLQIPSPCNQSWSQNTIRLILKNPVYSGSVLFQKTFVDESFRQRKNGGDLDRFLIEGHHEAIVERISAEKASNIHKAPPRSKPGRYGFTGRLICAECGSVMHRDCCNKARPTWICHRHKTQSGLCTMKPVSESDLKAAFINCLNKLSWSKMPDKYNELSAKYDAGQNEQKLVEIDAAIDSNRQEMNRLMARLMQNHQPKERRRIMLLQNKQKELLAERQHILSGTKADVPLKKLKQFINSWQITNDISSFPEGLFGSLVLNCTVNARKSVVFHFGCGISLKETLEMSDEECN